jgi:superfamily II DNA or RNA helicase
MTYKPRGWQIEALRKFQTAREKHFLLDATPGSGKTMFAGFAVKDQLDRRQQDFALNIVPNTTIKGDKDAGFLGDWNKIGIQITTVLKDGQDPPQQFRGAVITYQQLPNMMGTINTWVRKGLRMFVCFDELHHASEDNIWGNATEELGRLAVRVLGMTGTCFRGDERRISFVRYDSQSKAIPDHRYSYREAVTDHVCRPVDFITDDSMAQFMLDQANHEVRISEAKTEDQLRGATSTVYRTDHEFLPRVLEKADAALDQYRTWDRDAGGLIICRSGKDDSDNRHLNHVADLVHRTLGESPEVISYDDKDANAKIERFRDSDQRWICAVRKISEGVDIKRLRVEIMATRPTTELLFRQMVGRVVRVDDEKRPGDSTVFIAKFPQLVEWASVIAEEAQAGLKGRDEKKPATGGGKESRSFMSLAASHEDSGAISDYGDEFTADEVNAAELLRGDDPQLADIPITTLAHLQRKLGIVPEPMTAPEPPLQIKKKKLRSEIVRKQRRLAIQRNPQTPDFKRVWKEIGATFGPFNADDMVDNYSIEIMRQIDAWLLATIGRETHAKL